MMTAAPPASMTEATHDAETMDLASQLLLPYQVRWVRDRSMLRLGEKSRQIGWTWTNAFEDALNGVGTDTWPDVYFMATDQDAARMYVDDVRGWCEKLNKTAGEFTEEWFDPKTELKFKIHGIEFPNGSKLEATTSNPRRLRGRRGNLKLDEFAFHDDPRELLRAAMPATTWGYTASIWSTHNGDASTFRDLCNMANRVNRGEKQRGDMPWSLHRVTIEDACDAGLVERINQVTGQSLAREEFIEQCRSRCLTDDDFMQEYMCEPCSESTAWLTYELIAGCVNERAARPTADLDKFLHDVITNSAGAQAVYAGVDVGRTIDRFVIWVIAKFGTVYRTVGLLVWQDQRFARMQYAVEKLMALSGDARLRRGSFDKNGIGMQLAEWAEETYRYRAEGVTFSPVTKEDMATRARRIFDDRSIEIPDEYEVREDLHSIRKEVTKAGNIRFAGERTTAGHADRFWAMALALLAADSGQSQFMPVTVVGGDL